MKAGTIVLAWVWVLAGLLATGQAQTPRAVDLPAAPRAAESPRSPIGGDVAKEASRKLLQSGMDLDAEADLTPQQRAKLIETPLRGILHSELYFLDQACRLDRDQRRPLREAGERRVRIEAKKMNVDGDDEHPDVRAKIQQDLAQCGVLRPAQAARYQAELQRRNDHERRAIVGMLVARLDRALLLSADQREKLTARLSEELQDNWMQMQFVWTLDAGTFPKLSRRAVTPLLNREQRKVWSSLEKVEVGGGFPIEDPGMENLPWDLKDEAPSK